MGTEAVTLEWAWLLTFAAMCLVGGWLLAGRALDRRARRRTISHKCGCAGCQNAATSVVISGPRIMAMCEACVLKLDGPVRRHGAALAVAEGGK